MMKRFPVYSLFVALLLLLVSPPVRAQNAGAGNDPQQIKADLKNILDSSEFQSAQPADPSIYEKAAKWLREWWDKLAERFRDLFKFGSMGGSRSPAVQWVFIALFVAGGLYVAYRLVRSYLANRVVKQARARTAFDLDETEVAISREPNDWLAEAARQESEGDYRRAYRALFLAILLKLDQAGIVAFERGRTNGEYLRSLRRANRKELSDLFAPLTLDFDLRWYGEKPTTAEDAAAMRGEYDRLEKILAQEPKQAEETKTDTGTNAANLTPEQA